MARTFLEKPDGKNIIVDHKNDKKLDNRLENLRYITLGQNSQSSHDHKQISYNGTIVCKLDKNVYFS